MGACYRKKKINFQPNYLKFLSDLVFHSQHLPWAERQVTINFSPDATVLMTQTVTKTQGLCIKCAWLNFNLQKANVRRYRSRQTRADLLGEKNKETQRYHKRRAFEMMYEPGACLASMRSWVRTPRTHINTWYTNPIIALTVRWKSEERDFQKPRSQLTWPWSTKEQTPQKLCLRQGGSQGRATPKLFSDPHTHPVACGNLYSHTWIMSMHSYMSMQTHIHIHPHQKKKWTFMTLRDQRFLMTSPSSTAQEVKVGRGTSWTFSVAGSLELWHRPLPSSFLSSKYPALRQFKSDLFQRSPLEFRLHLLPPLCRQSHCGHVYGGNMDF